MAYPNGLARELILQRFSEARLVQITDQTNRPASTVDEAALERAANEAYGEFEQHASRFYVMPLATPLPQWLLTILIDLWAFRLLFNCRPEWLETEQTRDGFSWKDRRKEIVAWLEGLSSPKRESVLPGFVEIAVRQSTTGVFAYSEPRVMVRSTLEECF
jgi:phage gp36-like protein